MVRKLNFPPLRAAGLSLAVACSLTTGQGLWAEEVPHVAANTPVQANDAGPRRLDIEVAPARPAAPVPTETVGEKEIIEERFASGALKLKREVSQDAQGNYHNNGAWILYDERGTVMAAGEYRDGRRQGTWERQYASDEGKLFSDAATQGFQLPLVASAKFENGMLHGLWTVVDSQDRTICEWEFADGERHGKSTWYSAAGRKKREATFVQGQIDGEVIDYDSAGKVIATHKYVQGGRLVSVEEFHAPGKKKLQGSHFVPQASYSSYDWWTGTAKLVPPVSKEPIRTGSWTWWYASGQKQMEGAYKNDQPEGKFAWWHANGQERLIGNYEDGAPVGRFTWWYENGQKQMETGYVDGVLNGPWARWDKNGKIQEKGNYAGGVSPISENPDAILEETRVDSPDQAETGTALMMPTSRRSQK